MAGPMTTREPRSATPWYRRGPLSTLRHEFDDLVSQVWGDSGEFAMPWRSIPPADLSESDTAVEVRLDLPGVKPEEVDIQVSGNVLTVRGERKEEREEKGTTYHRVERLSGSFSRSIMLPCQVNEDEAVAQYKDGVLSITLPKTEQARIRKIKIKK